MASISAIALMAFVVGAAANPVFVRFIQPLSSGEIRVPPAHIVINRIEWFVETEASDVVGIIVNATNPDAISHEYFIVAQLSCISPVFRLPFICTTGSTFIFIRNGTSLVFFLVFRNAVDPERTQIDDVSLIVQEETP